MRLAGESYNECAARIERAINDPRCPAHGPIRPNAAATRPRPTPGWLVGPAKPRPPGGVPLEQDRDLRPLSSLVAKQEQKRIGLTDEEAAIFEANRYENFRRQHVGDRPLSEPDFWHAKNAAVTRRQRGNVPSPTVQQTSEPTKGSASYSPLLAQTPSDPRPKHKQADTGEQFFNDKVAEAQHCLDEVRRLLDALGQKLDAAKIDEEVDVDAEVDEIADLIWRYNDALESARDAWLRENLSGALNTSVLEMLNPSSLGLPLFTDDAQERRARLQGMRISQRLAGRDITINRLVSIVRGTEVTSNVLAIALGVGLVAKAAFTGGKWVFVKTVTAVAGGILADRATEAALRAGGASVQTITGARLAAAIVTLILLRRRSGSGGVAGVAETPMAFPRSMYQPE